MKTSDDSPSAESPTRRQGPSLRLLLLTGIPATGKTTVGEYLREMHGFAHLDFETERLHHYLPDGRTIDQQRIKELMQRGRDVVVTWGFVPDFQLPAVLALRDLGFRWIWFDGDRSAARREFRKRGTVPEELLDVQLAKIATHIDLAQLAPEIVNPFNAEGQFRPRRDIVDELLA